MIEPKVSVVIPTFNKVRFIEKTVRSVLNQNYPNIEVILIDNGSTDGTQSVLEHLANESENIRVIRNPSNLGPSGARNEGIKCSSGKYIFFLDGDDLFFPSKVHEQVSYMERHPDVGLTLTSYLITDEKVSKVRLISFVNVKKLVRGWFTMKGFGGLVESTGCVRRSLVNRELLFDETLMGSEGLDFTKKWAYTYQSFIIRKPLTMYRTSENQLHFDTAAISENMTRITKKYFFGKEKGRLLSSQQSFFLLNSMRTQGYLLLLRSYLRSANTNMISMSMAIISRNFVAYSGGFKYRRKLKRLLESVS